MVKSSHNSGFDIDKLDHRAYYARTWPTGFLSWKSHGPCSCSKDQGHLWRCREGNVRLQGSFYPERRSVPFLSIDHRKVSMKEPTHPSHQFCSQPRREVCGGPTNELGVVPGEPIRNRLQRSPGLKLQISFQMAIDPGHFYFLGDVGRYNLPGYRAFWTTSHEFKYTMVLKWHE